ncbi:MAG: pilus assembly protein PilM [Nitrospirae bacterium]|nr:pilus assembly protein PilM [Nitrospirota bacterium]
MVKLFRPAPLGVDLGSGSIKVIGLRTNKVSIAASMNISSSEREDDTLFINSLHNFFKELNIIGKEASVQIPSSFSFIRTITLPLMPKSELKEAVRWEIKRQLPYSAENAVYDYVAKQGADGIIVTFASTERENINRHIFPLKESGLRITSVDINPLCLIRAIPLNSPGNVIILDIGAKVMEIDIVKAGALRLTRSVDMGGEHLKNHLLNEGFSEEEADNILMNGPAEKMRDILNQILKEIFRSIDYYKATFKEKTFEAVILTGGVAVSSAIREYFSGVFDVPVSAPNPFNGLVLKDEKIRKLGSMFSVAIGLARRGS